MFFDENARKKKTIPPHEVKRKIADYCAYQERSQQEVRDKLYSYGVFSDEVEETIAELIQEGFINEERFARAYVRGKFKLKKWGRRKILNGLKHHRLSEYCVKKGWEEINEDEYIRVIHELIQRKMDSTGGLKVINARQKIANFLLQRGFEHHLIWEALSNYPENDELY
ncbi:RecX family transcriptional regulator [Fulvivirga sp. M361]|uniref:regulatory protein RecX n=1 Tax=Fulvivirga sp. M361 TaxID=2594266 RepID=UPI00117B210D|nr:RecX family transcriptional regulator [Fulvivirga sp. M361]TRX50424.1 RecX family transcriptional regulator [Fulvivirga sp. M361]